MAHKLKVAPFDTDLITDFENDPSTVAFQRPYEVISPVSWELNTDTNVIQEQGVLGNIVTHNMPFPERSYVVDWVGSPLEIKKILNYFTNSSHRHFVVSGVSEHNVITPGVMLKSKGMLASVAEKYRFPGELYKDYLPRFGGTGFNVGSMGVRVAKNSSLIPYDFNFIDTSDSAIGFAYLEANTSYTITLNPSNYGPSSTAKNNLDFYVVYYNLNNIAYSTPAREEIRLTHTGAGSSYVIPTANTDRIMSLSLITPNTVSNNSSIRGILNYVPPIIYKTGSSYVMDDYEDIPSLIMPMDNYVYNRISPNIAELSMNFKEISHVSE